MSAANTTNAGLSAPVLLPDKNKPFDMLGFLVRRHLPILVLGAFILTLLFPFALLKGSYFFEATGRMLIARETPQIIMRSEENISNYFRDYAISQIERIRSPSSLERAVKNLPEPLVARLRPQNGDDLAAAAELSRNLVVENIPNTDLISVKYSGNSPNGLAEIVNTIMDSYLQRLQTEDENQETRRIAFLTEERNALNREIEEEMAALEELVSKTRSLSFQDQNNIFLSRYLNLQNSYGPAYSAMVASRNEYEETIKEIDSLKALSTKVLIEEMVAADQTIWSTSSWTYQKLQDLRATIDGISKDNPDRRYVEKRMEAMQEYEQKMRQDVTDRAEKIVNGKRDYNLSQKLISAKSNYLIKEKTAQDIQEKMDEALAQARENALNMLKGQELTKTIENNRAKLFELEGRIHNLVLEARKPLRMSVESYAVKPKSPSGSNLKKLYMFVVLFSFCIPAVAFFIYDLLDDRIRSPKDIAHYIGRPPTWPISAYSSPDKGTAGFARVTLDEPNHTVSKAIRSLAVRLDKERNRHGAKIAVVSGIDPQNGTTEIALNLSHAMKHFCERVLLIDGNVLRPGLRRILALEDTGFCDAPVLLHKDAIMKAAVREPERGIDLLFLCEQQWNQEIHRHLPLFFHMMSEEYDFILIDAAPISQSDLTELFVVLSNVSVLVVQGDRSLFRNFVQSVKIMMRLEAPALAVVLNWGGPRPMTWFDGMVERIPWPFVSKAYRRLIEMKQGG